MTNKNNNLIIGVVVIVLILALLGFFGGYGMMGRYSPGFSGFMSFGPILGIIALIAAIWVIYDVLVNNRGLSDGMKVLWVVCAIFFSIITAIIYYLIGRKGNDLFRKR